ncbi:hypothetical protein [Shewanella sp. UCD-KL12]|uniref:hypothetical protein n=1 Tax=Shewanella sp. UCD-KL12 TaxID=1917163 RepID=UPI0009704C74|nr:hypothetical protein [Shewanella sp. UCD-KL12]
MYSIKRNLLLGIVVVSCFVMVNIYSSKLASISSSEQAHLYGTEQAYGRHFEESTRVSFSKLRKQGQVSEEQRANRQVTSAKSSALELNHANEFSSVSGISQYSAASRTTYQAAYQKNEQLNNTGNSEGKSLRVEKLRVSSVLNTFTFLFGISIISLVLVGDNQKAEFDEKMLFLSTLILIDFMFIGGKFTMLLPLIGLAILHARRYLGSHFTPHQE